MSDPSVDRLWGIRELRQREKAHQRSDSFKIVIGERTASRREIYLQPPAFKVETTIDALFRDTMPSYYRHPSGLWSGVYFLIRGNDLVYVGQAHSVILRIKEHKKEGIKTFHSWRWIPCSAPDRIAVERLFIRAWLPEYNNEQETQGLKSVRRETADG